jgi:hypothetical protein
LQERERIKFSLYPAGFLTGSVVELAGVSKTEFLSLFLCEHADFKVAWLEDNITINPYALFQKGVRLENLLFVEAKKEMSWCLTQILQSGCFQAVVVSNQRFIEKDLRRYQLLSERGNLNFFILSEKFHQSWVPNLQLEIFKEENNLGIRTYKKRGYA